MVQVYFKRGLTVTNGHEGWHSWVVPKAVSHYNLPRYYYQMLRPLVERFAAEHGLQYHVSGVCEIWKLNYEVMRKYSQGPKPALTFSSPSR